MFENCKNKGFFLIDDHQKVKKNETFCEFLECELLQILLQIFCFYKHLFYRM
jgi:hypothetical protein